jgi:hypothetical protein
MEQVVAQMGSIPDDGMCRATDLLRQAVALVAR